MMDMIRAMNVTKKLVMVVVLWRLIVLALGALAVQFVPFRSDSAFASFGYYSRDPWLTQSAVSTHWVLPWANFDGVHYLLIARDGYAHEARFFPVLPGVVAGLLGLTGISANWIHAD